MRIAERGFLTLAFGSQDYFEMANALVSSFRRFGSKTRFAVATDQPRHRLLRDFDVIVPIDPSFGSGVAQKLVLDRYSPFDETLFVDSDCLFYKHPDDLWPMFTPFDDFGVKGWRYLDSTAAVPWIEDLPRAFEMFGISRYPNLNGGIYYFRKTDRSRRVFETARRVYDQRGALGLKPFKAATLNDEVAYAIAIEAEGVELLPWDNGRAMDLTFQMDMPHNIDISQPSAKFRVHGRFVDPIVVHFNVGAQYSYLYALESAKARHSGSPRRATMLGGVGCARKNVRRLARRTREEITSGEIWPRLSRIALDSKRIKSLIGRNRGDQVSIENVRQPLRSNPDGTFVRLQ